jgi:hypothetical protein
MWAARTSQVRGQLDREGITMRGGTIHGMALAAGTYLLAAAIVKVK